jgi:YfiH family protein
MTDLLQISRATRRNCEYYIANELYEKHGVLVAFTGRSGGVSSKPFDGLNLGLHVGDNPEHVKTNRRIIAEALNLDADRLTCAEQVHGSSIAIIDEELAGRGSKSFDDALYGVDALITAHPGTPLALFYADCVPVVVVEPFQKVVAVIHAGWRGIFAGIIENAVREMKEFKGVDAERMIAFIGPSIGSCCFQVDNDLVNRFKERFERYDAVMWLEADNHIKLHELARLQLADCGIDSTRVSLMNLCTSCNSEKLFSYRADNGNTGRQAAIVNISKIDG